MPKKPKSGPPYTNIPDEVYVVVTNPWCMHREPRLRKQGDYDRIATWAQYALQQAGLAGGVSPTVECVYGMGTRNEIIMQFAEGTDIIPFLGEHCWARFRVRWNPNDPQSTSVFLYNWKNNGDPANHGWTENFPESLPFKDIPAISPYPAPSWTTPPSTLVNLVLPIPRPVIPPAIPDDENNPGHEQRSGISPFQQRTPGSGERPAGKESASTDLFRPYEPPPQHPSYAQFLNRPNAQGKEAPTSKAPSLSPKFIKKLDPYELEEDALNIIRSSTPGQEDAKQEEDIKPIISYAVKMEIPEVKREEDEAERNGTTRSDSGYQPSQALVDAFNSLGQPEQSPTFTHRLSRDPQVPSTASQVVPPSSLGYQPSAELEVHIRALLRDTNDVVAASPRNDTRITPGACGAVKREYEDDVATFPGQWKKIKIEED